MQELIENGLCIDVNRAVIVDSWIHIFVQCEYAFELSEICAYVCVCVFALFASWKGKYVYCSVSNIQFDGIHRFEIWILVKES